MKAKAAILTAFIGVVLIAACSSRITCSTTTFKTPIGEITHITRGQDPNRTMDITGDEEATGQCVTIQFKDGGGNPIGAPVTVTVPATNIPVPTGSTDIEGGECGEDEEATRASGGQQHISPGRPWVFFGGPINSDFSQPGVTYSFSIRDLRLDDARATRDLVLASGLNSPVPRNVTVHHYSVTAFDSSTSQLVVMVANPEPFQSLTLVVNPGQPNETTYTENDAALSSMNGWEIASFAVPLSVMNWGTAPGTYTNEYVLETLVEGSSSPEEIGGLWEVTQ